jgi:hypothetical protein
MSNIFDMDGHMPSLTYQEKSLYGTLAAELIIFGAYFAHTSNTYADLGRLTGAIVLISVVQIAYQIVLAITSRNRLTDERDRLIQAYSYRAAYITLVLGLIAVFVLLWTHASFSAVLLINVMFGAFVLAEVIRQAAQLVLYRTSL